MSTFGRVNAIYATMFGSGPPARACVGASLASPLSLMIDCMAHCEDKQRYSLHVQGISYWAPANIGPYSQAITVGFYASGRAVITNLASIRSENVSLCQVKSG